jgi:hypothetical protein
VRAIEQAIRCDCRRLDEKQWIGHWQRIGQAEGEVSDGCDLH